MAKRAPRKPSRPRNEDLGPADVLKHFAEYFRRRFRAPLPSNYCCWDLETTGFRRDDDLILEIGHCVVHDREPVHRASTLLDWTRSKHVHQGWLKEHLEQVKKDVEFDADGNPSGRHFHITYDRLRNEGKQPEEVLAFYFDLFARIHNGGGFFLGQNSYAFDAEFFACQTEEFLGERFEFDSDVMIDVGGLEKSSQLGMIAFDDETLRTYFKRVAHYVRKGVKWNIEHCAAKYNLEEIYGIDLKLLHGAGEDSHVCHLVFEEMRKIIEAT